MVAPVRRAASASAGRRVRSSGVQEFRTFFLKSEFESQARHLKISHTDDRTERTGKSEAASALMWRRNQRLAEGQSPDFSSRGHRPRSQMSSEGEIFVGIELSYSATPELLQLLNS